METNYLNKLCALFKAMEEDDYMIEGVLLQLENFPKYIKCVLDYVIKGTVVEETNASFEQVREEKNLLDKRRKQQHDAAIYAMNAINRCCDAYQVERITDIDTADRNAVANFIGKFVYEIYMNEINTGQNNK